MKKIQFLLFIFLFIACTNFAYTQTRTQNTTQIQINVVYVSGDVKINNSTVKLHQQVLVNQKIQTGADGHIYLKSADNGFLVLRPNSTAFVRAYSVDAKNPQNNRIKIELENGVARHISGEAVKAARQNFRFNTPVAAIGVRGTDFVIATDINASRIAVNSGGIAISPFNKTCQADGFGACQGKSVMELFANANVENNKNILEVSANDKIPRLLENITDKRLQTNEQENQNIENAIIDSNSNVPATSTPTPTSENSADNEHKEDVVISANPENPENSTKNDQNLVENSQNNQTAENTEKNTENTKKDNKNLVENQQTSQSSPQNNENKNSDNKNANEEKVVADNSENLIPAKVENAVDNTKSTIHWGRWKEIADKPVQIDLQNINKDDVDFIANNDYFAIFRDKGEWQKPLNNLQFSLLNSEAVLRERNGNISDAIVKNGNLEIDIAKQKFNTNLDVEYSLSNKSYVQQFKAVGNLSEQGTFDSLTGISGSTMTTKGALSHDNNEAAYIFQGRTLSNYSSPNNQIFGVTQWGIKK